MAESKLVGPDIEAGRQLLHALDQAGFNVVSAFWLLQDEEDEWRLIIASPEVDVRGPRAAYERIQTALSQISEPRLRLDQVSATRTTDPIVLLISSAIVTGPQVSGVRFTRNTINGVYIRDAYIYRSLPLHRVVVDVGRASNGFRINPNAELERARVELGGEPAFMFKGNDLSVAYIVPAASAEQAEQIARILFQKAFPPSKGYRIRSIKAA
jgi:hypothetical protein